jgi:hypothetical protein
MSLALLVVRLGHMPIASRPIRKPNVLPRPARLGKTLRDSPPIEVTLHTEKCIGNGCKNRMKSLRLSLFGNDC